MKNRTAEQQGKQRSIKTTQKQKEPRSRDINNSRIETRR